MHRHLDPRIQWAQVVVAIAQDAPPCTYRHANGVGLPATIENQHVCVG